MIYLFSIAMLLLIPVPPDQKLPDKFYQIPELIRESATVIISGTYFEGRSPCIFMADGSRRWFIESGFMVKNVYRGKVKNQSIRIKKPMPEKLIGRSQKIERGHEYLILLRPSIPMMERMKTAEVRGFWDTLADEEILAIVKVK